MTALVAASPAAADPPEQAQVRAGRRPVAVRPALRPLAVAFAAVLAFPLSLAGLAFAGVDLPGPAESAFDRVGLELPDQAGGEGAGGGQSEDVKAVIDATEPSSRGCEFGQAAGAAARAGHGQAPGADPCDPGGGAAGAGGSDGVGTSGGGGGQSAEHNPTIGVTFPPEQSGREFGSQVSQNARAGHPSPPPNPTSGVTRPPDQSGQQFGQQVAENARGGHGGGPP